MSQTCYSLRTTWVLTSLPVRKKRKPENLYHYSESILAISDKEYYMYQTRLLYLTM